MLIVRAFSVIQNREESQRTLLQFLHPAFHNHCKHTRLEAPQQQRGCEEVGGEEAEEARFIHGIGARPRDTGTDREWYVEEVLSMLILPNVVSWIVNTYT
jgi:hypothetical protein